MVELLPAVGIVVGVIVLAFLLLLARGMYLIGSGSDAEYAARSKAADVPFARTGFALLDYARSARLPAVVERLEELLGRETRDRTVRCRSCRHVWVHAGGGQPVCSNCNSDDVEVLD